MQFIEKNSFNILAAIYNLKTHDSDLEFILFPMVHIGSRDYYQTLHQKLLACDFILVEGVGSNKVTLLTLSYSIVEKIKRLNLVTQNKYLKMSNFGERVINIDIDGTSFDAKWRAISVWLKGLLIIAVPLYVIYLFLFGTKEFIARAIKVDDLPSRDEILGEEGLEEFYKLMRDERDLKMLEKIEQFYKENSNKKIIIGIVCGATHMRAISSYLFGRLKYCITKAEWVKVFDL